MGDRRRRRPSSGESEGGDYSDVDITAEDDGRDFQTSSSNVTPGAKKRSVKFSGSDNVESGDEDLYDQEFFPSDTANASVSRQTTQTTYSRQNSFFSRQNSAFSRQVSMLSRSSTMKSLYTRTHTLGRTLTSVLTGRWECEDDDEVEQAAERMEDARRRRLEVGEGHLERMTTVAMKKTGNLVKQMTIPVDYLRSKTMERIRQIQEKLSSEEMQKTLVRVKTLAIHASAGRPPWHPEPAFLPIPSSFNLCSFAIIFLALLFPIIFFSDHTRYGVISTIVQSAIGTSVGPALPPLELPKLGEVCSSGGFAQQELHLGSPTLDSTWWSTQLGDGAQIQLQSASGNLWWGPPTTPAESSSVGSPPAFAPSSPPSSGDISPPPPSDSSPPPPVDSSLPPPPSSPPDGVIAAAVNGTITASSELSVTVFTATNSFNTAVNGTFFRGNFYLGLVFKFTGENQAAGTFSGHNFTSGEDFSDLTLDFSNDGVSASRFYLSISNSSTFDGTFLSGTLFDGIFYNNSFMDQSTLSSLSSNNNSGRRRRSLLQTDYRRSDGGSTNNSSIAGSTPPPPPPDRSKYSAWGNGPIGLYTSTPSPVTTFINVLRINTTSFYLMAPNGMLIAPTTDRQLAAVSGEKRPEAVFTVTVVDEKRIQLQTYDGGYVGWGSSARSGPLRVFATLQEAIQQAGGDDGSTTFNVREVAQVARIRGVNLGGWLVLEEWMTPWLYDKVPDLVDGWQVQLQSATTGNYMTTWTNNYQVHCNSRTTSDWEAWHVRRTNDSLLQLRNRPTGYFLSAAGGGGGDVWSAAAEEDAKGNSDFTLHVSPFDGSQVMIQTRNGKFLRAFPDGSLQANGAAPGELTSKASWGGDTTFNMKRVAAVQGEWQISRWSPTGAADIDLHRKTFITEADWQYMASVGVNTVRIPVGYWIMYQSNPVWPFVTGSMEALDAAFIFAEKYNIRIWLSLHAAPGGQNRGHESASRDGILDWGRPGTSYVQETLNAVSFLADRYGKSKALFGLSVLNEPNVDLNELEGGEAAQKLRDFHVAAYAAVRQFSPCCFVGISGLLGGEDSDMDGHMVDPLQYNNVVYDVHYYQVFTPQFSDKNVQFHLDYVNNTYRKQIASLQQGGRTVLIGEWSLALPKGAGASSGDYGAFARTQLAAYNGASAGWFFWALKASPGSAGIPNWSFVDSVAKQWLRYT